MKRTIDEKDQPGQDAGEKDQRGKIWRGKDLSGKNRRGKNWWGEDSQKKCRSPSKQIKAFKRNFVWVI